MGDSSLLLNSVQRYLSLVFLPLLFLYSFSFFSLYIFPVFFFFPLFLSFLLFLFLFFFTISFSCFNTDTYQELESTWTGSYFDKPEGKACEEGVIAPHLTSPRFTSPRFITVTLIILYPSSISLILLSL